MERNILLSAVLWRLTRLDGKQKLNAKKLLLIALLVSVSGNYRASDFVFNASVGVTLFQAINFFTSSKEESRQSWLPMVYVSMAIYCTLRMTLVFEIPEILSMAHEWYMSAEEYLTANQTIEWAISLSMIAISVAIFFKKGTQEDFPLITGLISGLCGLEDVKMGRARRGNNHLELQFASVAGGNVGSGDCLDGQSGLQVAKCKCHAVYRGSRHNDGHGEKCGND